MEDSDFAERKNPVIPRFYVEAQKNNFQSAQQGRPVFDDVEMVQCIIPGDNKSMPTYAVNDEHRTRWAKQYEAFKKGIDMPRHGTPLKEWPVMTPSLIAMFAHANIVTIEELAAVGDHHLQNLGMGSRSFRDKARMYLDVAKNGVAPIERMMARIEALEQSDRLKTATIESQAAQIAELSEPTPKPKRNGHAAASAQ